MRLSPAGAWEEPRGRKGASLRVVSNAEKSQVNALNIFSESKIGYKGLEREIRRSFV